MPSTINAKNTSTGVVITPDASGQLELQTADTTRMTITSGGNVGIGTNSPVQLLTVESTSNVRATIRNSTENTSYSSSLDFATGSGSLASTNVVGRVVGLITQADPSALQSALTFHTNSGDNLTEKMRIDSSGNVGIGTSSPTNIAGYKSVTANGTSSGLLSVQVNGTDSGYIYADSTSFSIDSKAATPNLVLKTNGTERMRIDSSGNVQLSTANTSILNSSGRKILNQTGGTLQVLQTVKTDVFSVASSTFTDVTGMSVSITPSSTSSKILIFVDAQIAQSGADATMIKLVRNTTDIFIGDAAGSRIRTSTAKSFTSNGIESGSIIFLDSPATTSSTTYKIQMRAFTGTAYLNRSGADSDNGAHPRTASSITVMEIAG